MMPSTVKIVVMSDLKGADRGYKRIGISYGSSRDSIAWDLILIDALMMVTRRLHNGHKRMGICYGVIKR